jgi:acetylornithine deacetylase
MLERHGLVRHVRLGSPTAAHPARLTVAFWPQGEEDAIAREDRTDGSHGVTLSVGEQAVCAAIVGAEGELVELLQTLVRFDTTTHTPGQEAREEVALQRYLGDRLSAAGASVACSEPEPGLVAGHPMVPEGFTFAGRPQLVARFAGRGGGKSLLLNGHVDVVDVAPRERWEHDPFAAVVANGTVHGRGACDMKGGVACMVFAAETLARLGVALAGELIINTVTDEESTGAGGLASARTLQADAAIVAEPTGLDVWIACRGSLLATITVEGRGGHAGIAPRHPDRGGAVNAIEKMALLLEAIRRLREEWGLRPRHPYLSPADCVPTIIEGGEWLVSHPALCRLECHIEYLPEQADDRGWGSHVEREFREWIHRAAQADPWLAAHPPRVDWRLGGVPPAQVDPAHPIVGTAVAAARAVGCSSVLGGLDNWHDGATLTVEAGIPAICLGPGDIHLAHTTSERVPIGDLIACTQALAVTAMRYCGPAAR